MNHRRAKYESFRWMHLEVLPVLSSFVLSFVLLAYAGCLDAPERGTWNFAATSCLALSIFLFLPLAKSWIKELYIEEKYVFAGFVYKLIPILYGIMIFAFPVIASKLKDDSIASELSSFCICFLSVLVASIIYEHGYSKMRKELGGSLNEKFCVTAKRVLAIECLVFFIAFFANWFFFGASSNELAEYLLTFISFISVNDALAVAIVEAPCRRRKNVLSKVRERE